MVALPHLANAEVDVAKLRDYCLNASHPRGRHKARLFQSALGITAEDADWLRRALLAALPRHEAERQEKDQYGERWSVDLPWRDKTAARLVSCWVL